MKAEVSQHPELVKNFSPEIKKLFEIFGDEIRLVGGCVRDMLLNKKIHDFDFATKFLPEETINILEKNGVKALPTGVKFGTITAVLNKKNFEITTLRSEKNHDGRHFKAEFIDDYFFDAARRDFTINALYLDSKGLVYDYFGGISDLKARKVQFIGNAKDRISEDFLRILRFFRFSCEYAKSLDSKALEVCAKQKEGLKKLSKERVRQEFSKIILSKKEGDLLEVVLALKNTKILAEIFSSEADLESLKRSFKLETTFNFEANFLLRISALFLNEKTDLEKFFKEICATNFEKKSLKFFYENLSKTIDLDALKQLLILEEKQAVLEFYFFYLTKKIDKNSAKNISFLENFSLPNFPLKTKDFTDLGFSGKELGAAIKTTKEFWAKRNFIADKNELINFLTNQQLA